MYKSLRPMGKFVLPWRISLSLRQAAFRALLAALFIAFLWMNDKPGVAQSGATGTIVGTVTDNSGAAVPGASVSITNVGTNATQNTITSSTGTYSMPSLLPGIYRVTVKRSGFASEVVGGIELAVGKAVTVDVHLRPGSVSETVSVNATAVSLDTENAAVGQVIRQQQISDLPLNGRNFTQLLTLEAGASSNSGEQGIYRGNEGNAISIQGGRPDSNRYTLDGIAINDLMYSTPAVVPSVEVLQEFQEQTKGYSAAYGGGANQVNLTTKSGTNELHGTAYDYLRNDALDAYTYQFVQPPQPKTLLRQNQFGYSLGGPIWIPKLYDGRNRSFFFANYEGLRARASFNQFAVVPTPEQINGVFHTTIINPTTHMPYPNNTIPRSDFSQFAISSISHFPAPNVNASQGNYLYTVLIPQNADQQTYRFDQSFSDRDKFFARYTQTEYNVAQPGVLPEGTTYLDEPSRQVVGSYTHMFSPTILNQALFGWMQENVSSKGVPISESAWNAIGFKNVFPYSSRYTTFPQITVLGYSTVGGPGYSPMLYDQPSYEFSDTLSIAKKNHNIGIGIDFQHVETRDNSFSSPKFSFDGTVSGNPVADFLLGWPSYANSQVPTEFSTKVESANVQNFVIARIAPWIQDDWKVSPRLTLNLGLRWDFMPLPYSTNDNMFWLNPNIPGGGLYTASKKVIQEGYGGKLYEYSSAPGPQQWKVFAPRIGLAFRPSASETTVLRVGWGLFYDNTQIKESFAGGSYPFAEQSVHYYVNTSTLFPAPVPHAPVTSADLGFVWAMDKYIPPYVSMWTASVEREVKGVKFEADYLGSEAHHLTGRAWENAPYPYDPLHPTPVSERIPLPNIGDVLGHPFEFASNYNALALKAEHSGRSITFLASYTWSHSLDNKSSNAGINGDTSGNGPMNQYNWALDYATSSFDIKHRFVGNFLYQLPFGRGQAFGNNTNRFLDLLIGGWQANGILDLHTGQPFSIAGFDVGFINRNFGQRANIVGDPYPSGFHKSINEWFNTAAFVNPPMGYFGNSSRDLLRGPGFANLDFSLFKSIPLGDRVRWQTRGEFFNAFNHTNFGNPSNAVYASNFGVIGSAAPGRIVQVAMKLIW